MGVMSIKATIGANNVKTFILYIVPVAINIDLFDNRQGQINLHANFRKPSLLYIQGVRIYLNKSTHNICLIKDTFIIIQ